MTLATTRRAKDVPIHHGAWSLRNKNPADRETEQDWIGAPDGAGGEKHEGFTLKVLESRGLSLDAIVWSTTEVSATRVRGGSALYDPGTSSLTWQPETGVLLVLSEPGMDELELQALAETVEPVDRDGWQRITHAAFGDAETDAPPSVLADGVARGARWKVAAYQGTLSQPDELCVGLETDGGAEVECGFEAAGSEGVGEPVLLLSADGIVGPILVMAVDADVTSGRLERAGGAPSAVRAAPGAGANFLVVPLSGPGVPDAIVALDAEGRERARKDVPQPDRLSYPPHADVFPSPGPHDHPPVPAAALPPVASSTAAAPTPGG